MARLTGAVNLFLSPDGGHYLADAAALTGDGVRPLAHPPAFPALVASASTWLSGVGQVQFALGASLWLLAVALYLLCRQFAAVPASIAGAGIGVTFPAIAELLAWNGGATLLATAFLAFSLAACEWWLRTGLRRAACCTGIAAGVVLLAHPFVAAVAFVCIAARWLVEAIARARPYLRLRGSPFSCEQLALLVLPIAVAAPLALPYYRSVEVDAGVRFGFPRLGAIWDTLTWGLREQGVLLLLFVVFLVAMFYGGRASATIAGALGAVYLVVSSATRADPSYRTRVAYLLPIVGAIGAAQLWTRAIDPAIERVAPRVRRPELAKIGTALVAVVIFASLGYLPRIPRAAAFYQRLDRVDVAALQTLSGGRGLVATSWNANAYGNGISNAWYVEGLASRDAAGPTDPALSTLAREEREGAAMQQFFSGIAGVQNGAMQVSGGPPGAFGTPALQTMIDGMYRPVLYVNEAVNGYPRPIGRSAPKEFGDLVDGATVDRRVTTDGMEASYSTPGRTAPRVTMTTQLRGRDVVFEYRGPKVRRGQRLTIRLFPAYGVLWRDLRADRASIRFVADPFALTGVTTSGTRGQTMVLRGERGTTIRYDERDAQFGLQSVEFTAPADGIARFVASAPGAPPPRRVQRFDQSALARRFDVTDVVLWKDTGWQPRFADDNCFVKTQETGRLQLYHLRASCRARRGRAARSVSSSAAG
jgi:hypothetical protein